MANQWRSADQEWLVVGRRMATHLRAGFEPLEREARSPSAAADATVPMNTDAPLKDTHCSVQGASTQTHSSTQDASTQPVQTHSSAQDAATQSSWTILPRRRIHSKKRSRTPDSRLDIADSHADSLSLSPYTCQC